MINIFTQSLLRRISCETRPILVFDTSAIIALENNTKQAAEFLKDISAEHYLVFPSPVIEEIGLHNMRSRIAGRKEISDKTTDVVLESAARTSPMIEDAYSSKSGHCIDSMRYNIYWAVQRINKSFSEEGKEAASETDRKIIECAYLMAADKLKKGLPPTRVISSDSHILDSIKLLNHSEEIPYMQLGDSLIPYYALNVKGVHGGA